MSALQSKEKKICTQIFTANRLFNPFHTTGLFLYPLQNLDNFFFFSWGIERYQWHDIGYVMSVNQLLL